MLPFIRRPCSGPKSARSHRNTGLSRQVNMIRIKGVRSIPTSRPRSMPIVISTLDCLLGTSAMKWRAGFFIGNSLSDWKDPLIPFIRTNPCILAPSGIPAQVEHCSYQPRTRSARNVFHRLGRFVAILELKVDFARMRILQQPSAVGLLLGSEQMDRFLHNASPAHPRPSGGIRAHAARRSASGSERRTAASLV
jgi:hypothetical protein